MSNTINDEMLFTFEGMTSISALIKALESNPHARKIKKVIFDESKKSSNYSRIKFLKAKSAEIGFILESASEENINTLANGNTHGGFLAFCEKKEYPSLTAENVKKGGIYFMLEGIEDPFNFGYTIRSLYTAGVDGIILPPRNWTDCTAIVCRSSAGASELANIYVQDLASSAKMLKSQGFRIACANIKDSLSLYDTDLSSPTVFIIGGEKRGISRNLLELADINIRIDYAVDFKGSLPTSSAATLIAFECAKANNKFNKILLN